MPRVVVRTTQQAFLGRGREAGHVVGGLGHVPGWTLRGALAAAWIREYGAPQRAPAERRAEFLELFHGHLRYGPLYQTDSCPEPMSWWRHKYGATEGCARSTWDEADGPRPSSCPDCGQPLERSKGVITARPTVLKTHVRLTSAGTASRGDLFAREGVAAAVTFEGDITGDHAWLRTVEELQIGGRRSTSGHTKLQWQDHAPLPVPELSGLDLILYLVSPACFVDDAGRPSLQPDLTELGEVLGVVAQGVTRSWARPDRVGGWHAASGLPKPVETVAAAGSVYIISLSDVPDPDALLALAARGLGLRRREGFGWVGRRPQLAQPVAVTVSTDTTEHSDIAVVVAAGLTGSLIEALRRRRQQLEQAGAPAPPPDLTTLPAYGALSPTARAAYDRLVTTDDLDLLRLALARLRARAGDR